MKKLLILILLSVMCFTYSCNKTPPPKNAEGISGGIFIEETDTEYLISNFAVQPVGFRYIYNDGKNDINIPYAKESGNPFYEIEFEDPTKFLGDLNSVTGLGFVYREESLPDFTLENFNPVSAHIYVEGERDMKLSQWFPEKKYLSDEYSDSDIPDDSKYVYIVRDAFKDATLHDLPASQNIDRSKDYYIRLLSADYPGLYYTIYATCDVTGTFYLYDRGIKKAVLMPDEIISMLYISSNDESD